MSCHCSTVADTTGSVLPQWQNTTKVNSAQEAALAERHFSAGAGIKAQVCSLMELLTTTLYQAHALFYTMPEGMPPDPALPCGLLFSTLESTTGQHPAGECPGSSALGPRLQVGDQPRAGLIP